MGCEGGPGANDPRLFLSENNTLFDMVARAYRIPFYRLSAPDWTLDTRFDLMALVPEGVTKEQFPMMLQNLLVDRFKLKVHR